MEKSLHKIGINGSLKITWGVDRIDHTDSKFVQTGETPVLLAIFMSKCFDRRSSSLEYFMVDGSITTVKRT